MTARDARGRFVSEREHAATLLLEAAVAEAVRIVQESRATTEVADWRGFSMLTLHTYDKPAVEDLLAEATRSADLLLRSAS